MPERRHWPVHSLILAGGRSSRMGTDKAMLPIDGKPLLIHLTGQLIELTESVTIAAGSSDRVAAYREALADIEREVSGGRLRFVADAYPDDGPLAGLHAGLSELPEGYVFVIACDMPAVSEPLLARLIEEAGRSGEDVIHVLDQPFHALYHTRVTAVLQEALENQSFRVMQLLRGLNTATIPDDESLEGLTNLNTPEDYRNYINRIGEMER